jgi:hypothetical protein
LLFINIFNLQHFFFLQAMSLGHEPSPMELFIETHVRSEDRQKRVQQFIDNCAEHFVVCSFNILFHRLLFSWIEYDDFFSNFQETYIGRFEERYGDDPSTHLDFDLNLWMEAISSGGPDKNQVYGLSNNTANNLWAARSVSAVGSFRSILSTQSEEIMTLKQHMTDLTSNISNSRQIMNNSIRSSWIWDHRWMVHVRPIFGRMILGMTSLLLRLHHCSSSIVFLETL